MQEMKHIYGPLPSRRLGRSLGVSPIPRKRCNYSCIYCQLGRTYQFSNTRSMFYPLEEIISELDLVLSQKVDFDVVTVVGEGEPTLYLGLGELIRAVKTRSDKPVALITNGALLYDPRVREEAGLADIVLPSLDAFEEKSFRRINRPHRELTFAKVYQGLQDFSAAYRGQLWLEIMLLKDFNDSEMALEQFSLLLQNIRYDCLYINTPVRPPADMKVQPVTAEVMRRAEILLGGISIDLLQSKGYYSQIGDDYQAVMSIIRRHPMNQFEIESFLKSRSNQHFAAFFTRLQQDPAVESISYKGYLTYRLK